MKWNYLVQDMLGFGLTEGSCKENNYFSGTVTEVKLAIIEIFITFNVTMAGRGM